MLFFIFGVFVEISVLGFEDDVYGMFILDEDVFEKFFLVLILLEVDFIINDDGVNFLGLVL